MYVCIAGKRTILSGKEIEDIVRSGEDSLSNVIEDVVRHPCNAHLFITYIHTLAYIHTYIHTH